MLAGQHAADRIAQFVQPGTLGQVTGGAVVQCATHHAWVIVGGNHHHGHFRELRAYRCKTRQSVVARHVQVQQHQVHVRIGFQYRQHTVQRFGFQHRELGHRIGRRATQGGTEQRVVVGDQQLGHAGVASVMGEFRVGQGTLTA